MAYETRVPGLFRRQQPANDSTMPRRLQTDSSAVDKRINVVLCRARVFSPSIGADFEFASTILA
jgi:hypothetical protein